MSGDFSRLTFDASKHFSGVRMQQGRLQLDADWNEQMDILTHRMETEVGDFLGPNGVPADVNGGRSFAISIVGDAIQIGAGRCYIAGKLFENDTDVAFTGQPDYPGAASDLPEAGVGSYVAYLDAWQRHIAPAEDPSLVEVALGGADTATRVKNVWQVRLEKIKETNPVALRASWKPAQLSLSTGQLNARVGASAPALENQLYRVEIHAIDEDGTIRFKWSRDNGAVLSAVTSVDITSRAVTVRNAGRDGLLSLEQGDWAELTTRAQTRLGQPGALIQIEEVRGNQLIASTESWEAAKLTAGDYDALRRWDMATGLATAKVVEPSDTGGWAPLENAIEVRFGPGTDGKHYKPGDYWLIPARTGLGIQWPRDDKGGSVAQPPHGVRHHFMPLALLSFNSEGSTIWKLANDGDLRTTFSSLAGGLLSKAGGTMTGPLRIEAPSGDALTVNGATRLNGPLSVSGMIVLGSEKTIDVVAVGTAMDSPSGDNPYVTIDGRPVQALQPRRALNSIIVTFDGTVKAVANHDVYGSSTGTSWEDWASWVNRTAVDGELVIVVSKDALSRPQGGEQANALLTSAGASKPNDIKSAPNGDAGRARVSYALLFIKGQNGTAIEALQPYAAPSARIATSYRISLNKSRFELIARGNAYIGGITSLGQLTVSGATVLHQEPWQTAILESGWLPIYTEVEVGYFKDSQGVVHLRGTVKNNNAQNYNIFILPEGYRPSQTSWHVVSAHLADKSWESPWLGLVHVNTAGYVLLRADQSDRKGGVHAISLDGITFRT